MCCDTGCACSSQLEGRLHAGLNSPGGISHYGLYIAMYKALWGCGYYQYQVQYFSGVRHFLGLENLALPLQGVSSVKHAPRGRPYTLMS